MPPCPLVLSSTRVLRLSPRSHLVVAQHTSMMDDPERESCTIWDVLPSPFSKLPRSRFCPPSLMLSALMLSEYSFSLSLGSQKVFTEWANMYQLSFASFQKHCDVEATTSFLLSPCYTPPLSIPEPPNWRSLAFDSGSEPLPRVFHFQALSVFLVQKVELSFQPPFQVDDSTGSGPDHATWQGSSR